MSDELSKYKNISTILWVSAILFLTGYREDKAYPVLDRAKMANAYYQENAQWYLDNIPFFECSDKEIERVSSQQSKF